MPQKSSASATGKAAAPVEQAPDDKDEFKKHVEEVVIIDPWFWGPGIPRMMTPKNALKLAEAQKKLEGTEECVLKHENRWLGPYRERKNFEVVNLGVPVVADNLRKRIGYPYDSATTPLENRKFRDPETSADGKVVTKGSLGMLKDLKNCFQVIQPAIDALKHEEIQKFYDSLNPKQQSAFIPIKEIFLQISEVTTEHKDIARHIHGLRYTLEQVTRTIKFASKRKGLPVLSAPAGIPELMSAKNSEECDKAREEYYTVFEECTGLPTQNLKDYLKAYPKEAAGTVKRVNKARSGDSGDSKRRRVKKSDQTAEEPKDGEGEKNDDELSYQHYPQPPKTLVVKPQPVSTTGRPALRIVYPDKDAQGKTQHGFKFINDSDDENASGGAGAAAGPGAPVVSARAAAAAAAAAAARAADRATPTPDAAGDGGAGH